MNHLSAAIANMSLSPELLGRLLSLPRELRDEIYLYFIQRREPPPYPPFGASRHNAKGTVTTITHPKLVRYPPLAYVNRQLREEIVELARHRCASGQLTPELDIMVKGYLFYSAWTVVPMAIKRGERFDLRVKLRIFSTEAFRSNDGWPRQPGQGFRSLLMLLNNLLTSGPSLQSPAPGAKAREPYRIDKLTVDISFHDLYTPATWSDTSHTIFKMLKAFAVSGIAYPFVKTIRANCHFRSGPHVLDIEREWPVSEELSKQAQQEWQSNGFHFLIKDR